MPIKEVSPLTPSPSSGEVIASELMAQEEQKRRDFMQQQVTQQQASRGSLLRIAGADALDLTLVGMFNGGFGRTFDSLRARIGTGMYQPIASSVNRASTTDQTVDESFNPYGFIRDNPTVFKDDPIIAMMVDRGQFDNSNNIEQFWADYTDGKRFLDQQQQIESDWKNGHYVRNAATWAQSMILDPLNVLPIAFAGRSTSLLRGTLQSAGGMAALSLAGKKALDAGQPVANEPGLSDEGMALLQGAIIGGGLHGLVAGAGAALSTDTARSVLNRVARSDKQTLGKTFEAYANELETKNRAETIIRANTEEVRPEASPSSDGSQPTVQPKESPKPVVDAAATVSSGDALPANDMVQSGPPVVLPELKNSTRTGSQPWTRADLEKRIISAYDSSPLAGMAEGDIRTTEAALGDNVNGTIDQGGMTVFYGKDFPGEVKMMLQTPDGKRLRKYLVLQKPVDGSNMVRVGKELRTRIPATGDDFVAQHGTDALLAYLREIEGGSANTRRLATAIEGLRKMSGNPETDFLLHVHDNIPSGRTPPKQTIDNAADLPVGSTFKINNETFTVEMSDAGYRVLKDGIEVPIEGIGSIPVDKDTLKLLTPEEIAATRIDEARNAPLSPTENAALSDMLDNEVLDHWAALEMDNAAKREAIYDGYVEMVAAKEQEVLQQSPERQRFASEVGDVFGETGLEAMPAIDAFAKRWAKSQGKTVDDYYATLKVVKGGKPGEGAFYSTIAWHGSPHSFDKFSIDKIGTGEGAQVYGHGLYFADAKSVAEHYRDTLSDQINLVLPNEVIKSNEFETYFRAQRENPTPESKARSYISGQLSSTRVLTRLSEAGGSAKEYLANEARILRDRATHPLADSFQKTSLNEMADVLDAWSNLPDAQLKKDGKLYKVELAPDEGDYLLWDKPLREQSDKVKAAVQALGIDKKDLPPFADGKDVYREIAFSLGKPSELAAQWGLEPRIVRDEKAASAALHKAGVRGVKYLDGNSRTKGKGAYNYVIFDDADVTIKEMFQQGQVGVQGSYEVLATGQRIIRKMEFADASTFIHEVGHDFLTMLPHVDPELADEAARALGAKSYADITVEHQEHWSRALEAFFREGKSPTKELEPMFKKFRQWLTDLYRAIIETPLKGKLNDDVRAVFKKMLSDEVTDTFDNHPLTEDEVAAASDLVGIENLSKYSNAELRRFLSGDTLPESVGAATANEIYTPKQMHPESVANSIRATYRELEWRLQQEPVDNTNIVVTAIPGDKAWSLIEQLKAKYEAAGKTLNVHQSNEQPLYQIFRATADFLNRESDLVDALPKDFMYGGIDAAAAKVSTRIVDLTTSWLTVNGRLASQTMLGRISDVWKTISGSSMTVPTGSAKDPFGFRWGTSAENFKLVLEAKMTQAKRGIVETYEKAQRDNETITFGDRTLKASRMNFGGATQFAEMVSGYAHQVQAKANGLTDKDPFANTSPIIKEAYKFVRSYFDEHIAMMVDTGMLKSNQAIKDYFSAMWKIDRVKADPVGFKFALEQEYRRVEAMKNGVQLPPEERPIVAEAAKNVRDALTPVIERRVNNMRNQHPLLNGQLAPAIVIDEATFLKELSKMTEGELRGDGLGASMMDQQVFIRGAEAYENSVRKFYRDAAEKAYNSLTNKKDPQAIPTDGRTMRIDYSRMQQWMETDPLVVMDRYHHVVGGRLAVRRSVQLNPEVWGTSYLKDGTKVVDGQTMKQYIGEMIDAMEQAASNADSLNGVTIDKAGGKGTKLAEVANLRSVVYADIAALIDKVEGRTQLPNEGELADLFNSGLRTARRATVLNLMNSNIINQLMDIAGIGMVRFARNTEFVRMLTGMARSVEAISKKDLAPFLAQIERAAQARSLGDIEVNDVVMGHSAARRAFRSVENTGIKLVDLQQKITLMDWWTKTIKQAAGRVAIETTERNVRKMIVAWTEHNKAPSKGGIEAAMRKAGIDKYESRRTNFLVGNIDEMQTFADQVFEHGVLDNGKRVKSEMTYDEFLTTKKRITPNFSEWQTDIPEVNNLLDKVKGNLAGEVNHRLNVTPGAGDQPRWGMGRGTFAEIGKMGTQFLNFGMAQSNQMFRTVAQQPFLTQANFGIQLFGLAALSVMIAAYLSGRRTPTQTLELWQKNPLGMTYDTVDRGGFMGILGKPLGVLDSLGSPYTPGNFIKAMPDQTATRRKITDKTQLLGPSAEYIGKWWDLGASAAQGRFDQQMVYNAWKVAPYQNMWWLRLLNRTTGAPVVPEAIRPPSKQPAGQPRI